MKAGIKIALLVFLIGFTSSLFSQEYWEIINTPPDLLICSIDNNIDGEIFIGVIYSTGGGLYKSSDNGISWDLLGFENVNVSTICIDKSNNIYASDGSYLHYSTDNGDNWDIIYSSLNMGISSLKKTSDGSIIIGEWGGIYKCDSIGSNSVQVLSLENTEIVNAVIEDINSGTLYAGTTNFIRGGGVFCSVDGGDNWEYIGLTDHYVSSLSVNSSGDLFAATRGHYSLYEGGVYILPKGQSEWVNLKNMELVTSIVINSEDDIYIGCSTLDHCWGGVRRSRDNG